MLNPTILNQVLWEIAFEAPANLCWLPCRWVLLIYKYYYILTHCLTPQRAKGFVVLLGKANRKVSGNPVLADFEVWRPFPCPPSWDPFPCHGGECPSALQRLHPKQASRSCTITSYVDASSDLQDNPLWLTHGLLPSQHLFCAQVHKRPWEAERGTNR